MPPWRKTPASGAYFDYLVGRREAAPELAWGYGLVHTQKEKQEPRRSRAANIYGYSRSASSLDGYAELDTEHGRMWNDGMRWIVSQMQGSRLEIRDPMGQTVASLGTLFANSRRGREPKVRTFGHLVVGALDNSIVTINGLRDTTTSASAELWRDVRAINMSGATVRNLPFGAIGNLTAAGIWTQRTQCVIAGLRIGSRRRFSTKR